MLRRFIALVKRRRIDRTRLAQRTTMVRRFRRSDIGSLRALEKTVFPDNSYPDFFFTQANDFLSDTFFVAEHEGKVVGYALGAANQTRPEEAWVLSMAVLPEWRGRGVGAALLSALLKALCGSGVEQVLLTTAVTNHVARRLYEQHGFHLIPDAERDYFSTGRDTLVYVRTTGALTDQSSDDAWDPQLIMDETDISVSFMNIVFAVSLVIMTLLATSYTDNSQIAMFYLFVTIFAALYSSLFFANVTGNLSRLARDRREVEKLVVFGNVFSELLAIYPLVIVFPLIVWVVTSDVMLTWIALVVDMTGFLGYQFSGYDLLRRYVSRRFHAVLSILIATLSGLQIATHIGNWDVRGAPADWLIAFVTIVSLFVLSIHFARSKSETHSDVNR